MNSRTKFFHLFEGGPSVTIRIFYPILKIYQIKTSFVQQKEFFKKKSNYDEVTTQLYCGSFVVVVVVNVVFVVFIVFEAVLWSMKV